MFFPERAVMGVERELGWRKGGREGGRKNNGRTEGGTWTEGETVKKE